MPIVRFEAKAKAVESGLIRLHHSQGSQGQGDFRWKSFLAVPSQSCRNTYEKANHLQSWYTWKFQLKKQYIYIYIWILRKRDLFGMVNSIKISDTFNCLWPPTFGNKKVTDWITWLLPSLKSFPYAPIPSPSGFGLWNSRKPQCISPESTWRYIFRQSL